MIAPIILPIILAITAAASAAIKAAPTEGDKYRNHRIKQLDTLAQEGFTADQEEELRTIGMGAAATAEREARSRRGDALAILAGGATANDIMAAEARDTERAVNTRQAVENKVTEADLREREVRRQELNQLMAQKDARTAQQRDTLASGMESVVGTVSEGIIAQDEWNKQEGMSAVKGAASRQAGLGTSTYDQGTSSTQPNLYDKQGFNTDLQKTLEDLTPEQRAEILRLLGSQ